MNQFSVLLQKEWRENTRNFKILWIPLVFIAFGIIEPLTYYFLPQIMKSVGNMPEDTQFIFPKMAGEDIFFTLIGQYQSIGVLVIVLGFMGAVSRERKSGTGTLLYVRPLSFSRYFLSKWIIINAIILFSIATGFLACWYYVQMLYNPVELIDVFKLISTYGLWMVFVVTVVLAASAWLPTGGAAGVALVITLVFQIIDGLLGQYWTISPWKLATYAPLWVKGGQNVSDFWWSVVVSTIVIIAFVLFGIWMSKRNAANSKI